MKLKIRHVGCGTTYNGKMLKCGPYSVKAWHYLQWGVGSTRGRNRTELVLTKCDLKFEGEFYENGYKEEDCYCFPSGDLMHVGQAFGQKQNEYVDIRVFAKESPQIGSAALYVQNKLDTKTPIWVSHYYNINSGFYSTTVDMSFRKVVAKNLAEDSWGFKSYDGVEDFAKKDSTFLQHDFSSTRTLPFNSTVVDYGRPDKEWRDNFILRFNLKSSLAQVNEKYTSYNVASLMEDIGGMSASAMFAIWLVYVILLRVVDRLGPSTAKHPIGVQDYVARLTEEARSSNVTTKGVTEAANNQDGIETDAV